MENIDVGCQFYQCKVFWRDEKTMKQQEVTDWCELCKLDSLTDLLFWLKDKLSTIPILYPSNWINMRDFWHSYSYEYS